MGVSKTIAGWYTSPDNPAMPSLYDISGSSYIGTGQGAAPSGYGSEYDKLFAANPYRNLSYKESLWQKILSSLGFRTDADRWKEDAQVNSAEYDAGIYSLMQQNEFNSPAAQAARMREAGQNPDLLGTGDVVSAASPAEDPNGMSQNVGSEFEDFGNIVSSVFTRAMAIFKDFKSLEQMNAVIDSQNVDNAVKLTGAIDSFIESSLTRDDMVDFQTYSAKINALSDSLSDDELLPFEKSRVHDLGLSKRQRQPYYSLMRDRLLSMATDEKAYDSLKRTILAQAGSKEAQSNPFSFGMSASEESAVDIMVKGLSKAHRRALEFTAKAQAHQAFVSNKEAQTLEEMNAGQASAGAQVAEYNSRKLVAQWNRECARLKKDMLGQLERSALAGDWLAKAMLFSWSLDDIARMNVGLNAGLNLSFGANFGANLSNSVSTIFKP